MSPEIELGGGSVPQSEENVEMAEPCVGLDQLSANVLLSEATACSARRIARADQLQGDSDRMWSVFMTTPNVMTGVGYRTLQQSSGYPAASGTGTDTK